MGEVPAEYDALRAGERDEALTAGAADRREMRARSTPQAMKPERDRIGMPMRHAQPEACTFFLSFAS
jgi:hypothetical protein